MRASSARKPCLAGIPGRPEAEGLVAAGAARVAEECSGHSGPRPEVEGHTEKQLPAGAEGQVPESAVAGLQPERLG